MAQLVAAVNTLLGLHRDAAALSTSQIALRGVIVFVTTLATVRVADRRFLSQKTAFDAVLGFILASMLARAVNGNASFFPTIAGGFVLVALHRLMAHAAYRSHAFGDVIKGRRETLIRDGVLDVARASRDRLSQHDLLEDLRLNGNVDSIGDVALGVYERNGQVSVVRKRNESGGTSETSKTAPLR